jgi:hypothetical protein
VELSSHKSIYSDWFVSCILGVNVDVISSACSVIYFILFYHFNDSDNR